MITLSTTKDEITNCDSVKYASEDLTLVNDFQERVSRGILRREINIVCHEEL